MNARSLTIGGILLTAFGTVVYASADLIASNPKILFWIGYVILATIVAIFGSWGVTEYYKKTRFAAFIVESINKGFNPKSARDKDPYQTERRLTYRIATWTSITLMLLAGYIFRLLEGETPEVSIEMHIQVIWILWGLYSLVVGFSSAPLWRFSYDKIRPKLRFRPGERTE